MINTILNTLGLTLVFAVGINLIFYIIFNTNVKDLLGIQVLDDFEEISNDNIITKSKSKTTIGKNPIKKIQDQDQDEDQDQEVQEVKHPEEVVEEVLEEEVEVKHPEEVVEEKVTTEVAEEVEVKQILRSLVDKITNE